MKKKKTLEKLFGFNVCIQAIEKRFFFVIANINDDIFKWFVYANELNLFSINSISR